MEAENILKEIQIRYTKTATVQTITITDQGNGFNWPDYMYLDPALMTKLNGRGIATARLTSFDEIKYNDTGNEVTAIIYAT
jgi:anti-sigma regulatory factor (Ser/Thr protein kinase)